MLTLNCAAAPPPRARSLVITGAEMLGVTPATALELYGKFFVSYVQKLVRGARRAAARRSAARTRALAAAGARRFARCVLTHRLFCAWQGYGKLLYCLGDSLAEFLINLNNLHRHLSMSLPNMVPPAFRCEKITSTSLELHYYSPRPALWPIVKGIVLAVSEEMFHHKAEVELILSREAGTSDHEVFAVTYPPQENMRNWNLAEAGAPTSIFGLNNAQFYRLFPFHILLDKECRVLQCGHALQRLYPDTLKTGTHVQDTFRLRHPHIEYEYEAMVKDANTSYLLTAHTNGMELKGMIFPTDACAAYGKEAQEALLFLASPRVACLDDLQKFRLFLSDIPLHDMSRDYVLLAEQRSAEVDIKNLFEKNLAELNATMKALNTSNAALQAAKEKLTAEQERSDALLYQMLPRGVADKLRHQEVVDAIEYNDITILFSDIVGFSTIASRCSARAVCDMLNELYIRFDALIESPPFAKAGIYKVETIGAFAHSLLCPFAPLLTSRSLAGDAYMCVCNLETPCEDHADALVAFASAMHAAAAEVSVLGAPLRIRVGIHSGPAVGGVVGRRKPAFCLFGTSVNTASRSAPRLRPARVLRARMPALTRHVFASPAPLAVESHGVPGMTHLSRPCYDKLKRPQESRARLRGTVDVKGLGPMETFLVPGLADEESDARAMPTGGFYAARNRSSVTVVPPAEDAAATADATAALASPSLAGLHMRSPRGSVELHLSPAEAAAETAAATAEAAALQRKDDSQ